MGTKPHPKICVLTASGSFATEFNALLRQHAIEACIIDASAVGNLDALYAQDVVAAVVDNAILHLVEDAWRDLLASLGRRIPVVVLGDGERGKDGRSSRGLRSPAVTILAEPSAAEVLQVLDACGVVGINRRKINRDLIPFYNPQAPLHMLQNQGALSVVMIDASSFRKIAIEYGAEAYTQVQDCFSHLLSDLWGQAGCFRAADLLCRRSEHSNTYYIFLQRSRKASAVPVPGVLEELTDRLMARLHRNFWHEICSPPKARLLPDCLTVVPDLAIGFATAIHNPCVDSLELLDHLLDSAAEESKLQLRRMRDRQRELMQTLVHTPGMLVPNFQAVFHLPQLTADMVAAARSQQSLKPLQPLLYGFESLIRVNVPAVEAMFRGQGQGQGQTLFIDPKFLRPDVLFALSHAAKIGLELDQACLQQAVRHAMELPGTLLVNILPRNLYNIEQLRHLIADRQDIMFEVSETEAINNFDLMVKVRAHLKKMRIRIAADDFGRGYSGLEQIVRIKPDLIKLDRSLIQEIHRDPPKQAFVAGLVTAAKFSGATILAEGVEEWQEAEVLQAMGIELIQGFLLHRPAPAASIVEELADQGPDTQSVA